MDNYNALDVFIALKVYGFSSKKSLSHPYRTYLEFILFSYAFSEVQFCGKDFAVP